MKSDEWYVIDLDTDTVDTKRGFACFHNAIQWGDKRYTNYTAMRGRHIRADDRWIIPED